jgi:hypothetical protein
MPSGVLVQSAVRLYVLSFVSASRLLSGRRLRSNPTFETMRRALEPALSIGDDGGAAFLPDDAQLDAELAVAALRDRCKGHVATGRYTELFYEPVQAFLWCVQSLFTYHYLLTELADYQQRLRFSSRDPTTIRLELSVCSGTYPHCAKSPEKATTCCFLVC